MSYMRTYLQKLYKINTFANESYDYNLYKLIECQTIRI